jgi:hypothetical protein
LVSVGKLECRVCRQQLSVQQMMQVTAQYRACRVSVRLTGLMNPGTLNVWVWVRETWTGVYVFFVHMCFVCRAGFQQMVQVTAQYRACRVSDSAAVTLNGY